MSGRHSHEADADCRAEASESAQFLNQIDAAGFDRPLYRRVLVVFGGRCGVWWLRWLKPGFRHCFAAVDDGVQWLTVDPLLHRLEIRATGLASGFDLATAYRNTGLTVVEVTPLAVPRRTAPLGLFTCVETVKRLLGIRAPAVLTPWQFHRLLTCRQAAVSRAASLLRTKQENNLDTSSEMI